jgi:hypothetical protein
MYANLGSAFITRLYYRVKPYTPWCVRMGLRRWMAGYVRRSNADSWPILASAGRHPAGWGGWPEGKRFAFVLTHDVEGKAGLGRCRELAQMDAACGFRSSFNFVPEGEYAPSAELREWLRREGFEVGLHDLRHDGRLYDSRAAFRRHAVDINNYLKAWDAVGFRSGFMHHNLDWLHQLNIEYDASTFDTDPFEPQPDGVGTIFPFWVAASPDAQPSTVNSHPSERGYIELPYTLTQDSTLFVVLQEKTTDIWKRKLEWIAKTGGMALLNVHPDYVSFNGSPARNEYPGRLYREFLDWVKANYEGQYWQALPREVAGYALSQHKNGCRNESARFVVANAASL